MLERLPELVNGDAALVRRGRFVDLTFLVEVGETSYLVHVERGRVASVARGPFIMPRFRFALRAPREAWETFWRQVPPPGFNDLLALLKGRLLRMEGDLHPLMANLLYFKGVMAAPRQLGPPRPEVAR